MEAAEVVEADKEVIAGGVPGGGLMVNKIRFDISVVVVLLMLVPEEAEPGIWMAICTVPGLASREAGTGAVTCELLTRVVFREVPFHRMIAPVVKPAPLAVSVKLCPPAVHEPGLTKLRTEDDVWMERLVLYWEQAQASPQATSATISNLREHIRTRSSRAILPRFRAGNITLRSILKPGLKPGPDAEEVSDESVSSRLRAAGSHLEEETHPRKTGSCALKRENPHQTGLFLIPPEYAQVNRNQPNLRIPYSIPQRW